MTDFQKKPVRNYLQRREQWRLLTLVLALGLVGILINEVSKPHNWRWFAVLTGQNPDAAAPADSTTEQSLQQSPANLTGPPQGQETVGETVRETSDDTPAPLRKQPVVEPDPALKGVFDLTPEQIESIEDDTFFLGTENDAWFRLLKILRQNSSETLKSESTGPATYTQIMAQPNEYRGKLISLEGTVCRANPITAARNDAGFKQYWRLWLAPRDNVSVPIVVYCLDLPDNFPTGMKIRADVELEAFFFKRWAYNAWDAEKGESTLTEAPVVLAKTVTHHATVSTARKPLELNARFFITIIAVATISSFLIARYVSRKTQRGRAEEPEAPVNLDNLAIDDPSSKNGTGESPSTET